MDVTSAPSGSRDGLAAARESPRIAPMLAQLRRPGPTPRVPNYR